jgi:hypothetical protein
MDWFLVDSILMLVLKVDLGYGKGPHDWFMVGAISSLVLIADFTLGRS